MITPKFLQELISSPEYGDKNSETYKRATKYMNILYPGTVQFDATGRMMRPDYDMTLQQFYKAQDEIYMDFEVQKEEATDEVMEEYGEYFETIGFEFNIEEYVISGTPIPVKVLMPGEYISNKDLITYKLDIPEFEIKQKIWIWHSEHGENTCNECAGLDGQVFFSPDEIPAIPVHPNCKCSIVEETLDKNGKTIAKKDYKADKNADPKSQKPSDTPTFKKPVNVKPGQYAVFDGKKFTLYENDKPIMSWDAVSGKDGYRSPEYQNMKDTGPIPEGTYVARQSELQRMSPIDWVIGWSRLLNEDLGGKWPGSEYSWGSSRVWLEPSKETNTYGRDDFSIHGGWVPGSAGCIDLTSDMDNFVALFDYIGNDLIIKVEY